MCSSNSIHSLKFTQFGENVLTTTCRFPSAAQQTAEGEGSVEWTTASQTDRCYPSSPLVTLQDTLAHDFQQTLQEECPTLERGPLTPIPEVGGDISAITDPDAPPLHCQQLWAEQKSFGQIHTTDALAKLFQTLDCSHVPTHVLSVLTTILEAFMKDMLSLVIKT